MSKRAVVFLSTLLVLAATAVGAASPPRLDELVLRNGLARMPYSGTDAGVNGSGLRLTAMGRWRDARGTDRYTIWQLRNSATTERAVRFDSAGGELQLELLLRAGTETYLRSPVTDGSATHRLWSGTTQIASIAAGSTVFNAATPVSAGDRCRVLGTASDYNGFFFGNFTAPSSDVQGRLAAGGKVDINNYSIADQLPAVQAGASLVSGGDLVFPSGRLYAGSAWVGGSAAGVGDAVRNGLSADQAIHEGAPLPVNFAAEQTYLLAYSSQLAALPANTTWQSQWGGLTLHGDNHSALQVFQLPGDLVGSANTFAVDGIPAGATVLFNISGTSAGLANMSLDSLIPFRTRTLFNFPQATSLRLASIGVQGSILAPRADIRDAQGVIQGNIVAKSWTGQMQLNQVPFQGCGLPAANRAPVFLTNAPAVAKVGVPYRYAPILDDPDNDLLQESATTAPSGYAFDSASSAYRYTATAAQLGAQAVNLRADDGRGGIANQPYSLRVVQDFCPLYPIGLPDSLFASATNGQVFKQVPRGNGTGNFSWLSWTGSNSAPTLAASLVAPGDSYTYINPDNAADHVISVSDWLQGGPGNMNSSAVRSAMDALLQHEILIPTWSQTRGQGSHFDYKTARFAAIVPSAYQFTGQGWLSFTFKGYKSCYADAPIANDQQLSTPAGQALNITLTATDPDGDALTYSVIEQPTHGTLSGTAPNLIYTPAAGYAGPDRLRFTASDGSLVSEPGVIAITVVPGANQAPTAQPQQLSLVEDTQKAITLTGVDPEGSALSYTITQNPTHGSLSGTAPNVIYTPAANYSGSDSFAFRVSDGSLSSADAVIALTITPLNDAPVADNASFNTDEDVAVATPIHASDVDGDSLSYLVIDAPAHGSLSGTAPALTYTPAANFNGTDHFSFRANDGQIDSNLATVTVIVRPRNDAPLALDQNLSVAQGTSLAIVLSGSDIDGDSLSFRTTDTPQHGQLSGSAPNLSYTPDPTYSGSDEFHFVANDGSVDSAPARVRITITPVNRAPHITSTPVTHAIQDTAYSYDVDAIDPDVGDVLGYSLTRKPAGMTINTASGMISWMPAQALVGGIEATNTQCRSLPGPSVIDPGVLWHFEGGGSLPEYNQSMTVPLVARLYDENGDGHVDEHDAVNVVVSMYKPVPADIANTARAVIRIFNGATGAELAHTPESELLDGASYPALGDIDGDGLLDIVSLTLDGGVAVFANDGSLKWRTASFGLEAYYGRGAIALADLDADGKSEIIVRGKVLSSAGQVLFSLTGNTGRNHPQLGSLPSIADLDGDGKPEIVAGATAYRNNGSVLWNSTQVGDGYTAIGNVIGDSAPEVVVVSNGTVSLLHADGSRVWGPVAIPEGGYGGPPTLADVDGDGQLEIGVAGAHRYVQLNHDGTLLWSAEIRDGSSQVTGSTVFDFDGDGSAEVLYNDERFLRIYRGADGAVLFEARNTTGTLFEYPVVADVDGVAGAEIIVGSNAYLQDQGQDVGPATRGVTVYHSLSNRWMPTRSIWNQHAYHIDNINDDGSVPRVEAKSWLSHNTFRLNTFIDRNPLGRVDLALFDLARVEDSFGARLVVRARNRGLAPSAASIVRFYADGALIGESPVPALAAGTAQDISLELPANTALGDVVRAVIDEAGSVEECLESNNDTRAAVVTVRATDPAGLYDAQTYTINVAAANHAPTIVTTSLPNAQVGTAYSVHIDAMDSDIGDAVRYTLLTSPAGMTIDDLSGDIQWTPTAAQVGPQTVVVRVTDLSGAVAERSYALEVVAPLNHAPHITSTPVTHAVQGTAYAYDVDAVDPDVGDVLGYSLTRNPAGMTINTASGMISWTPAQSLVGGIEASNTQCRNARAPSAFDPSVRWSWTGSTTLPTYDQVMNSPVVVPLHDTNADGRVDGNDTPDIAFVAYGGGGADWGDGVVRLIRGDTGQDIFTVTDPTARVPSYANLAAADLNGDGVAEIIAPLMAGGVVAINSDGTILWKNPLPARSWNIGGAAVADLDGDGSPEIILGKTVYSANGQIKWQGSAPYEGNSHASPIGTFGMAADLRPEPGMEVVSGPSMYSAAGALLWRYDALGGDGATAIGDIDADGEGDIVVVSGGRVVALNRNGQPLWAPVALGDGGRGGPPTIADFDGDGTREIGVAGRSYYFVFGNNGQLKWKKDIIDYSSNITGSTLFDFDGDGAAEVLQADEKKFRVFDGATGNVRLEMDNSNGTAYEYPVVADVDRDGSADIVLVSNLYYGGPGQKGIRLISSATHAWMPTRSIWNQHAYHIDNINDDGTVPRVEAKSWLGHNTFRLNAFADRDPLGRIDLALFDLARVEDSFGVRLVVRARNRGLTPSAATLVRFYADGNLIGQSPVPALGAGTAQDISLELPANTALGDVVRAVIDEAGSISECLESNNDTRATVVSVRATDPGGLYDAQTYTISVTAANHAPTMVTTSLPNALAGTAYSASIVAADSDIGDALRYTLMSPPVGMTIDDLTGDIHWAPTAAQIGTHTVAVRVTDLSGANVERSFSVIVSSQQTNRPPRIVSTPTNTVNEASIYRYDVDATDPDVADILSYATDEAPAQTTIDALDGKLAWPAEASLVQGVRASNTMCRDPSAAFGNLTPKVKWHWNTMSALSAPVVGPLHDTNGDGHIGREDDPSVVFAPHYGFVDCGSGRVVSLDGKTGLTQWTSDASLRIGSGTHVAMGDLEGDGQPEVVAYLSGAGTVALDANGQLKWQSAYPQITSCYQQGAPTLADLDGDGKVEILANNAVLNFDGTLRFRTPDSLWSVAVGFAADFDMDGKQEAVLGNKVYSATGTLLWQFQNTDFIHGAVVVNLDDDPNPEIVAGANGPTGKILAAFDHDGHMLWSKPHPSYNLTPVTAGDVDLDGKPEFATLVSSQMRLYDSAGNLRWAQPVQEGSHATGAVMVDLDGNGISEIVYGDETTLRIFDGATGQIVYSVPNGSATATEAPVVADIDNDGHAELLVTSDRGATAGLRAIEDVNDSWVGTRTIWNQRAYSINNINDDMTIPRQPAPSWLAHNSYRMNAYPDRAALGKPDLAVFDVRIDPADPAAVLVHAVNRGLAPIAVPVTVRLHAGVDGTGVLLGSKTVATLAAGASVDLRYDSLDLSQVHNGLSARIDADNSVAECAEDNNLAAARLFQVRATDPHGLAATQRFTVSVDDVNQAPVLQVTSLPNAVVGRLYRGRLNATDPDRGDGLRYALDTAPAGMTVEPVSGELRWTAPVGSPASVSITARVVDLGGLATTRSYTITVGANSTPQITSVAPLAVAVGATYSYAATATDADGDALNYTLTQYPPGMTINATSGLIEWTPQLAQAGNNSVVLSVSDGFGGSASQSFVIVVDPGNRPPSIDSTPPAIAHVSLSYTYPVHATDPDAADVLSYALLSAPAGMTINSGTGMISWTPQASQLGTQSVSVQVSDGHGGTATQSFSVLVSEPSTTNNNPQIVTTAVTSVALGGTYVYDVDATDVDGDGLVYALLAWPSGMLIDGTTGRITWTPPFAGSANVQVWVSDGRGGSASQSFTVTVTDGSTNAFPQINTTPVSFGKVGHLYTYNVDATDADGDALVYSLQTAPAGMTIDTASGLISWMPGVSGSVPVRVRVSDGRAYAEQSWTITVASASDTLSATVSITPASAQPGATITITVNASGAAGPITCTATLDGQPVTLSPCGSSTLTAPTAPGVHTLVVTVTDGIETTTQTSTFLVVGPDDGIDPVVAIHAPIDNAAVTAPSDVIGSISDANLARWTLALRPGNSPQATPTILATGTGAVNHDVLAQIDPTRMFNGVYVLILDAEDAGGRHGSDSVQVRIDGDMKLGNFSISFLDAEVPLYGIPIRVTRTYDTRQSGERLDFGYGWSVDYQNVRVRESRKLGFSWRLAQQGGGFGSWCVRPAGTPVVTVTLPDGQTEQFRARFEPECTPLVPTIYGEMVFEPVDSGTQSKLAQLDYGQLRLTTLAGGATNLIDLDAPDEPVDPRHYQLTTADGMVYFLDQTLGIQRIVDPAGNHIDYTHEGIVHSSGASVQFVRDASDRISSIVLPDGRHLDYAYNAAGDLVSAKDALGLATTFDYLANVRYPHYLQDITDPRGVRVARNEYDVDGRLTATIDADGKRMEFTHDIAGHVERVRNRRGDESVFVYDDNGWVLSETNPLGQQTTHTYDENGNELTRTDALNRTTTNTLDVRGNMLQEKNAMGQITTRTWGYFNQLKTEVDAMGRPTVTNRYQINSLTGDETPYLNQTTDALGNSTGFILDLGTTSGNTGNIKAVLAPGGGTMSFGYDGNGNVISQRDALGHVLTRSVDTMGRVLSETTTRTVDGALQTQVTQYSYDAKGQLLATTAPDGSVMQTSYNEIGKPVTRTDPLGRVTRFEYDARGQQTATVYPDGTREETTYDAEGNVIARKDKGGRTTKFTYDAANRLIDTIEPDATSGSDTDNPRIHNVYDAAGQLVATTDPRGNTTHYGYDPAGRPTTVTDALDQTTTTTYDASGRRTSVMDALGQITSFVYDATGRLTETHHDDASVTKSEYDAAGRRIASIDAAGRTTRYAYDVLGRLTAVVMPNPATGANPPLVDGDTPSGSGCLVTHYAYDESGSKLSQTDALGRVTAWKYDALGRPLSRRLPLGQVESYTYDLFGRRLKQTDFRGIVVQYEYDAVDRVSRIDYPTQTDVTMDYTSTGQLAEVTDANGTTHYDYDLRDRLIKVTYPDGTFVDYSYDAAGNRTAVGTPNQSVDYAYDELNRLRDVTIHGDSAPQASYAYNAVGNRAALLRNNGTRTEYSYDRVNRLTGMVHKAGTAVLLGLSYQLDPSGLRTQIDEVAPTGTHSSTYHYDAVKRLTGELIVDAVAGGRSASWTYDAVGNRLSQIRADGSGTQTTTSVYDANDRLQTANVDGDVTTYSYDDAGNTTRQQSSAGVTDYAYDDANRLVQLTALNGEVTRYAYDHTGIRRSQTRNATGATPVTTRYLVDPNQAYAQVIEETTQTGGGTPTLSALYTFGDDRLSLFRPAVIGSGSDPGTPASLRYYHADGLGSTRLLSDASGAVTDRTAYEAFGEIDPSASQGSSENNFLYTGEQHDPNSGFYYLRARYMDQGVGRFTQRDTFDGYAQSPLSLHDYGYADMDPVNGRDPSGYMTLTETSVAQDIQANLRTAMPTVSRKALDIVRKAKIFAVYDYVTWPLHFYMYVERTGTFSGFRYDVGNDIGWGGMFKRNPFGVIPGGFVRSSEVIERRGITGRGKKIVTLTWGQWLFWHYSVVGTEETSCMIDTPYSLTPGLGTNCLSWTIWGTAKAILASRLPQ